MEWILLGLLVLVVLWVFTTYNSLVTKRNRIDNAWGQVEVQTKRRYDLIPNLVETVKGYASHEQATFERVVQARSAAQAAGSPAAGGVPATPDRLSRPLGPSAQYTLRMSPCTLR